MQIENYNKNHVVVHDDDKSVLFSYGTAIVKLDNESGQITLDVQNWDYSATTARYRNKFIEDFALEVLPVPLTKRVIEQKIKSGEWELDDLNS